MIHELVNKMNMVAEKIIKEALSQLQKQAGISVKELPWGDQSKNGPTEPIKTVTESK